MAERHSSEPALDEAIDRTVREMMNADARLGFERRVMRRLTEPPAPSVVRWPRLAGAAAIIATVLVAAILLRGTREPQTVPQLPDVAVRQSPQTPAVTPSVPTVTPRPPSTVAAGETTQRAPRPTRGDGVVMATGTEPAIAGEPPIATIAALDPPTALAVENIEQRPVNVGAIRMPAIDIPRLDVEALGPRDERSRE